MCSKVLFSRAGVMKIRECRWRWNNIKNIPDCNIPVTSAVYAVSMDMPEAADQMMCQTTQGVPPVQAGSQPPVLVPVDFSSCSRAALVFAIDFAQFLDMPLLILRVVHDADGDGGNYRRYGGIDDVRPMEDAAVEMMEDFIHDVTVELTVSGALDSVRKMVVKGLPSTRINEVAKRVSAASIIMGTHGRKGLSRLVMGSVAGKVVQFSNIPVTVIKDPSAGMNNAALGWNNENLNL